MGNRIKQSRIYFVKFMSLFMKTGGWKAFIFGGIISLIIAMVVGDDMFVLAVDTESGCFSLVSACIWIGIFNSIQSVCKERDIIKREHRSGMHISSYIIARAWYEFVICLVQAVIMLILCKFFFDLPAEGPVTDNVMLDMFITMFVILLSADYLGLAISSIVKTTMTAMTVMPFMLIVQLVFSGVLFKLSGKKEPIAKLTISKWGMEAFGSIANINSLPQNAKGFREAYEFTSEHVMNSWLVIIIFAILYLAIAIISLEFVDKDKR